MGGATLMPGYSWEYPTFMPKKYLYINYTYMYSYSGLYSLFLKSKCHSHLMCRHPLSRSISKPLFDGSRKQELEPIPAQSLLRFPAMVAARDCRQQLVAMLGWLTLPPHWCRAPLYCAGVVGQLGRP
jgi:hypothetical protein